MIDDFDPAAGVSGKTGRKAGFFRSRWCGEVSLDQLFWRDMVFVATAISIASSITALILLILKMPLALVLAIHFAPVPYNIFLTCAVWRTAEKAGGAKASMMMLGSALWLIATVVA